MVWHQLAATRAVNRTCGCQCALSCQLNGGVLGVFVYGTLRPGSWNHDRWLAPLLAGPCRPARMASVALHHHGGLPYLVPAPAGSVVLGDIADLRPDMYAGALEQLDALEDTASDHYRRVTAPVEGGEEVWVWLAGAHVATELGPHTLVDGGDWLALAAGG